MDRTEARARGEALRAYIELHLPVEGARTVTRLAVRVGLTPNTVTNWWTRGTVPDLATLELVGGALGVAVADLVEAYNGTDQRARVLTDARLEALLERAAERGAEIALERHGAQSGHPAKRRSARETIG